MQTVTVNDLAATIMRPGEELRVTGDRIRNWTREGLLSIAGEKNPGTGRARLYKTDALLEAVLLQILADNVGISVGQLGPVLDSAKRFIKGRQDGFLIVSRSLGEEWRVTASGVERLQNTLTRLSEDTHTLIDVKRVLERAFAERK